MDPTPLPAFVGIGALKAGTTYLDSLLRGHPDLSFPRILKETEFFNRHHERGLDWYSNLFDPDDGRLRGDISPQYVSCADCPNRIHAANPDVKVLVTLRDPVRRIASQHAHWVQETAYRGDLDAFMAEHPNAVDRSRYKTELAPWLNRFGRDQVHIIVFEDLIADPVATARTAFTFLGVDTTWTPEVDGPTNRSVAPRFLAAYVAAKRLSRMLNAQGHGQLAGRLKASPLVAALKSGRPVSAEVSPRVREHLAATLQPDIAWVSEVLDRDMSAIWR